MLPTSVRLSHLFNLPSARDEAHHQSVALAAARSEVERKQRGGGSLVLAPEHHGPAAALVADEAARIEYGAEALEDTSRSAVAEGSFAGKLAAAAALNSTAEEAGVAIVLLAPDTRSKCPYNLTECFALAEC